jgi:uncharacterized protein DUF3800
MKKRQRLYCYVDESGQDTAGELFLVAVVVIASKREELRQRLAKIEYESGKGRKKWTKATRKQRAMYIERTITDKIFAGAVSYSHYTDSRSYVDLTILTTAKAILKRADHLYQATVYVDGLRKSERQEFTAGLRKLHVSARLVRGIIDEADEFIRLADAVAGFVRDVLDGDEEMRQLYARAVKHNVITKI